MRNKYSGVCYYCGLLVEKGQGHFEKVNGIKKWRTIHSECVFKQRHEKQTEANKVKQSGQY